MFMAKQTVAHPASLPAPPRKRNFLDEPKNARTADSISRELEFLTSSDRWLRTQGTTVLVVFRGLTKEYQATSGSFRTVPKLFSSL